MIFPGALGDLVCFLPALEEIARRSGGRPLVVCKAALAEWLRALGLAEAEPIEGRIATWLFSAEPPAAADALFGTFRSIECFTGFGVPEVEKNLRRWGGRVHRFRPPAPEHLAIHFLREVGAGGDALPEVRVEVPAAVRRLGTEILAAREGGPLLVVHPGSGGIAKRWSRHGFAEIAERWSRTRGAAFVVLGPAEEGETELWRSGALTAIDDLDLVALSGLVAGTDAYLGNDSGASHLAGALGARGVVVFGASDPELWRPLSPALRVVVVEPWSGVEERASRAAIDAVFRALDAEKSP